MKNIFSFLLFLNSSLVSANSSYDFTSTVALNGCSGMIVKFDDSKNSDLAMLLTAAHCLIEFFPDFMPPNHVMYNEDIFRHGYTVLNREGNVVRKVFSEKVLYATYTTTDMALFQLTETNETLARAGLPPRILSRNSVEVGTNIEIISSYWRIGYSCQVDKIVYALREADWTTNESIRYGIPGCHTKEGTSGAPIINKETAEVIGINSTINESGERCTQNNPCEVNATGNIYAEKDRAYGQQVYRLYGCKTQQGTIDLNKSGCQLPKPQI